MDSALRFIVLFEAIALAVFFLLSLGNGILGSKRSPKGRSPLRISLQLLLSASFLLLAYAEYCVPGRAILSPGLLMPGSYLTSLFLYDVSVSLRRLSDPSLWFLLLLIATAVSVQRTEAGRAAFGKACFLGVVLIVSEASVMTPAVQRFLAADEFFHLVLWWAHAALTQAFFLLLLWGNAKELLDSPKDELFPGVRSLPRRILCACAIICVAGFFLERFIAPAEKRPLVGAHYYSWFPDNWSHGYASALLKPKISPALGEYRSGTRDVAAQHVAWAKEAGIDFFVFDWWPERRSVRQRVKQSVWGNRDLFEEFGFAILYETLDLKTPEQGIVPGEDPNVIILDEERANRLKRHWEFIAKHYMRHPSYLHVDGRPVLFVYATRHVVGPVRELFDHAREHVRASTGVDLYLIGDEAFFNVLAREKSGKVVLKDNLAPHWKRLAAFDALTCYNPYDSTKTEHGGTDGAERFLDAIEELYAKYKVAAVAGGQAFFPGVLPGYNDRGVRLHEDHYVVPRDLGHGGELSFFGESLRRLARPFVSHYNPIVMITSWNEWNEGTQIEPTEPSPVTNVDVEGDYGVYSAAEYHSGYACRHLDELAEFLANFPRSK